MKMRADFVTNSSSVGYIVAVPQQDYDWFKSYVAELDDHEDAQNEGVRTYMISTTLDELNTHVNGGPLDWASEPSGPKFVYMSKETYEKCKEAIEMGHIISEVSVDYGVCEDFYDDCSQFVIEELS